MPQLVQLTASLSIWVYANDHAPPHFHLLGPDTQVIIRISDLQVLRGKGRRRDLDLAIAWAVENIDVLRRAWSDRNVRP